MNTHVASQQKQAHISQAQLENISLFGALKPEQVNLLLGFMEIKTCTSGEKICMAGDFPSNIYVVLRGRVEFVVERNDVHHILESFQAGDSFGDSFGEFAVIGTQRQAGTAIAVGDDLQMLVLTREILVAVQEQDMILYGILMMNIARTLSRRLHAK